MGFLFYLLEPKCDNRVLLAYHHNYIRLSASEMSDLYQKVLNGASACILQNGALQVVLTRYPQYYDYNLILLLRPYNSKAPCHYCVHYIVVTTLNIMLLVLVLMTSTRGTSFIVRHEICMDPCLLKLSLGVFVLCSRRSVVSTYSGTASSYSRLLHDQVLQKRPLVRL